MEAIERSHHERGIGRAEHQELAREDLYQRSKQHHKPVVDRHEFEKHERGAFRDEKDASLFTMHPKRAFYKEELDMKRDEHARQASNQKTHNYFDDRFDTQFDHHHHHQHQPRQNDEDLDDLWDLGSRGIDELQDDKYHPMQVDWGYE